VTNFSDRAACPANAFSHRFTVPDSDIDELGHAGNVSWVRWINEAAAAHSRSIGLDLSAYRRLGVIWVVRRHDITYLAPAFASEPVEAVTWVDSARAATSLRRTCFYRDTDNVLLARAETTWALLDIATGKPTRIPRDLMQRYT
jgi:acyl-CoA thioester hydrolase